MSWFGFGGSKKDDDNKPTTMNVDSFDNSSFSNETSNFASVDSLGSSGSGSIGLGGASGGSFEAELMAEQQKAMIQAIMFKLTDVSFDNCIPKPSSSLSSSEQACIAATVGKYLETTEFIVGRFQGQK